MLTQFNVIIVREFYRASVCWRRDIDSPFISARPSFRPSRCVVVYLNERTLSNFFDRLVAASF